MSYATSTPGTFETSRLGQRIVGRWPELGLRLARLRQFRATVAELDSLTDRELADIGMHRSDIRDIAREHVYPR